MRLDGSNGAVITYQNLKFIFLEYAAIFITNFSITSNLNSLDNIYILNSTNENSINDLLMCFKAVF